MPPVDLHALECMRKWESISFQLLTAILKVREADFWFGTESAL